MRSSVGTEPWQYWQVRSWLMPWRDCVGLAPMPTCELCAPMLASVVAWTVASVEMMVVSRGGAPVVVLSRPPWQNVHSVCQFVWFGYVPVVYGP